jgi:hypothetical protein
MNALRFKPACSLSIVHTLKAMAWPSHAVRQPLPNPVRYRRAGRRCPELHTASGTAIRCRALENFICSRQYAGTKAAHDHRFGVNPDLQ